MGSEMCIRDSVRTGQSSCVHICFGSSIGAVVLAPGGVLPHAGGPCRAVHVVAPLALVDALLNGLLLDAVQAAAQAVVDGHELLDVSFPLLQGAAVAQLQLGP